MTFVDGEPIDAAKLGALETRINLIQSSIPTFGPPQINIDNKTISSSPQLEVGTSTITILSVKSVTEVVFKTNFTNSPIVVVCLQSDLTNDIISVRVMPRVSASGFSYATLAPKAAVGNKISINYIAVNYTAAAS